MFQRHTLDLCDELCRSLASSRIATVNCIVEIQGELQTLTFGDKKDVGPRTSQSSGALIKTAAASHSSVHGLTSRSRGSFVTIDGKKERTGRQWYWMVRGLAALSCGLQPDPVPRERESVDSNVYQGKAPVLGRNDNVVLASAMINAASRASPDAWVYSAQVPAIDYSTSAVACRPSSVCRVVGYAWHSISRTWISNDPGKPHLEQRICVSWRHSRPSLGLINIHSSPMEPPRFSVHVYRAVETPVRRPSASDNVIVILPWWRQWRHRGTTWMRILGKSYLKSDTIGRRLLGYVIGRTSVTSCVLRQRVEDCCSQRRMLHIEHDAAQCNYRDKCLHGLDVVLHAVVILPKLETCSFVL